MAHMTKHVYGPKGDTLSTDCDSDTVNKFKFPLLDSVTKVISF